MGLSVLVLKSLGPAARLGAGVLCLTGYAWALPLDTSACASLDLERNSLESTGVLNDLRMTAQEAKSLEKDRLQRIQRYVDLSGQILFRCSSPVRLGAASANVTTGNNAGKPEISATGPGDKQLMPPREAP